MESLRGEVLALLRSLITLLDRASRSAYRNSADVARMEAIL